MSVLIYAESPNGMFKKPAFEAVTFGKKIADSIGVPCIALVLGNADGAEVLGRYGADKILHCDDGAFAGFDSQVYSSAISQVAKSEASRVVVVNHSSKGKALIGRLAVRLNAGSVSGVNALPDASGSFAVSKSVFSGKAIAKYSVSTETSVVSLMGNTIPPEETGSDGSVESISLDLPASKVTIVETKTVEGKVPLPEAELVVSAGRGMKDPENWNIIEELADVLGATTACSRPVADTGWRPHHEHVGQTGVAIRPNLYIAIGISGAIQHLAGVSSSKTIVVINKDPEAPFFKAADYGVEADLFEVVPRLTESLKKFKAS